FSAGCLTALVTLCSVVRGDIRHVIIHSFRPQTPRDFVRFFSEDIAFHHLHMSRSISPLADIRAFIDLCVLLWQLKPDVVHCHSSKAGFLGRVAAKLFGIPSAYTPHGYAFLRTDINFFQKFVFKIMEQAAILVGTAVISCGHEEYLLTRMLGGRKRRIYCIANSVNLKYFDILYGNVNITDRQTIHVGTCSRLDTQRNPPLFGALASTLKDIHWTWIGAPQGDDSILPAHVARTGWLAHADALKHIAALDIYVHTSLWEGLSYALLEAMSLCKPVVATNIPANVHVVQHGITGFLGSTCEELAGYVRLLATDEGIRKRMGNAAREYVSKNHNADCVYSAYESIYRSLAQSRDAK
ncbi:MAG: glycosyltransferase, partial [Desulfovibrio sp.]|nr:glycosyltransferase [Desulfovibrio sp.]